MKQLNALIVCASLLPLSGCVGLVAGGIAAGTVVATNERSAKTQYDDKALQLQINRDLSDSALLKDHARVSAVVYNGRVLLLGQTKNDKAKSEAERITARYELRDIFNEIRSAEPVDFSQQSHDTWLTTKVKSALLSAKDVEPTNIKVVTENDEVFLIAILSEAEAGRAVEAARHVDGVKRVVKVFEYKTDESK